MIVRDALATGRDILSATGSAVRDETPALDAEVLLRHVLGITRSQLFAGPERLLTDAEWRRYRRVVGRRAKGEPVAYLSGRREFMGLEFRVDRRVLIPRPETELLVERALAHIGGDGAGQRLIDVGTGSGAIAISLAVARPALTVVATDVSPAALAVARANARRLLGTRQRRLRFLEGSLEPVDGQVDVIAANLPYVPASAAAHHPELKAEPFDAVFAPGDGLEPYRRLVDAATTRLTDGGVLLLQLDRRLVAARRNELPALQAVLAASPSAQVPAAVEAIAGKAA